jgi:hypothetical protein
MKKVLFTSAGFMAAAALMISLNSCKKVDCTALALDVTTAATAYTQAPTDKAKCQAYKDAIGKWLAESKCTDAEPSVKTTWTAAQSALNCN